MSSGGHPAGAEPPLDGDVAALRALGLDDSEIIDVVFAVAARCFFSTTLDALGLQPDAEYRHSVPEPVAAGAHRRTLDR